MTPNELEQALEQAKKDLSDHQAKKLQVGECSHGWMDEMDRKQQAILAAERALAAARGEEHAIAWPDGVYLRSEQLPRLFLRDRDRVTFLAAVAYIPPEWKGKLVEEEGWGYTDDCPVLRIEYRDAKVQATAPKDDDSHRLWGRGLNSSEMMQVVHPDRTSSAQHYLMMFDGAWIEIEGVPASVEIWAVTLDEVARHCAGTPVAL